MESHTVPVFRNEVLNYLRSCEDQISARKLSTPSVSKDERERVAIEALLKIDDLTDAETEAVQEMLHRLGPSRR